MSETRWKRKLINDASSLASAHYRVMEYQRSSKVTRIASNIVWIGRATIATTRMATSAAAMSSTQVEAADPAFVEPVHALRVDEHRTEAQAGEERRRHALAALVEELDHRRVRADGDDERRARLRTRAASRRPRWCRRPRTRRTARPTRRAARDRARDRRGARGARAPRALRQRALRHRVEVADDDVGLEADLEQRVGTAVDADEHRAGTRGCTGAARARSLR